jgi:hypothetical protein
MITHLTVPRSFFILETFKVPKIGNFIHRLGFGMARVYNEMALCFVGFSEMVENNQITPSEKDLKVLNNFKSLFESMLKSNPQPKSESLQFIIQCAEISLKAINKVFEINAEKASDQKLKSQIFKVSSKAVLRNLKKYNEPAHEN